MNNQHNGMIPKNYWLAEEERDDIAKYARKHPTIGYRRLSFMMIDEDVVAASPSSIYRVLKEAELLGSPPETNSGKGMGFQQPTGPHKDWHLDIAYLNIRGTFYYLCSVLDGYSRYIVHWEIRESMKESEVEVILQRAKERFPEATPKIITDNGPQFIARDFKEFIRKVGMTHVRTSPHYPQRNGKIERFHRSIKSECIRRKTPTTLEEAQETVTEYVRHYNEERLHSGIGYITPESQLEGRAEEIFQERKKKLDLAREKRRKNRPAA